MLAQGRERDKWKSFPTTCTIFSDNSIDFYRVYVVTMRSIHHWLNQKANIYSKWNSFLIHFHCLVSDSQETQLWREIGKYKDLDHIFLYILWPVPCINPLTWTAEWPGTLKIVRLNCFILNMKKLKTREVKELAQGHTTDQQYGQNAQPRGLGNVEKMQIVFTGEQVMSSED